ncbi:hypothetical protein niasHS_010185 [Heterodera schachtii]|uniref:Pre-mRNA polyadenylation factor Fip1 domain-containing protein n=1 Tax=Heterodera schachtii TaxID=97005 RepID=A0ABD2J0L0_HETSC
MSEQQQQEEVLAESPNLNAENGDQPNAAEQANDSAPEKGSTDDRPAFLNDDESDEDDFVVTIGEIKTNVFQKQQRAGTVGGATIDLDANPTLKDGSQIYDIDLATMEDKPWRKPGADITDYFNYGFNEDTWNQYCERQRKFRAEFGTDQAAINKAILSNIQISGPVQVGLQTFAGGRQLVSLVGGQESKQQQQNKVQKIVLDLSKPPPSLSDQSQSVSLISRTVISGSGIITRQESSSELSSSMGQPTTADGALPQPITSLGSSSMIVVAGQPPISIGQSLPPPPASETPPPGTSGPPASTAPPPPIQNISVIVSSAGPPPLTQLPMDFSKPPPNFDPAIPPPIVSAPPSGQPQPQQQQPPRQMQQPQPSQTLPPPQSTQAAAPVGVPAVQMPPQLATRPSAALEMDLPPGVEDAEGPPGVEGPPGISDALPPSRMNFGQPPSTNQFSLGPSSMSSAGPPPSSASFGPPGISFNHHPSQQQMGGIRPAPLFHHSFRNPFGGPGGGGFVGRFHHSDRFRGGGRPFFKDRSPESDNDSPRRKKRRSRSKSRSPSPGRRHKEKDEKRKERSSSHRDKEGKKKKDKKHSSSSGHHRSPSRKDIKTERRSSEREKDSLEKEQRRRSPNRRDKEMLRTMKTERRTPEKD